MLQQPISECVYCIAVRNLVHNLFKQSNISTSKNTTLCGKRKCVKSLTHSVEIDFLCQKMNTNFRWIKFCGIRLSLFSRIYTSMARGQSIKTICKSLKYRISFEEKKLFNYIHIRCFKKKYTYKERAAPVICGLGIFTGLAICGP